MKINSITERTLEKIYDFFYNMDEYFDEESLDLSQDLDELIDRIEYIILSLDEDEQLFVNQGYRLLETLLAERV